MFGTPLNVDACLFLCCVAFVLWWDVYTTVWIVVVVSIIISVAVQFCFYSTLKNIMAIPTEIKFTILMKRWFKKDEHMLILAGPSAYSELLSNDKSTNIKTRLRSFTQLSKGSPHWF